MQEIMIRVKSIRHFKKETKFVVFTAALMKQTKTTNTYQETKNVQCFVGHIMAIYPNDRFCVTYTEQESAIYGHQYKILTYKREEPGTLLEIKAFLSNVPGLGPARIKKVLDLYGLDSLNAIRTNEQSLDFLKLPVDTIQKVRQELINNACFEKILNFLHLNNLDYRYAMPIFKKYGENAFGKIHDNPYALYLDSIIDFKTADSLNFAQKNSFNTIYRLKAAVLACLREDTEMQGNLFLAFNQLQMKLEQFLSRQHSGYMQNTFQVQDLMDCVQALEQERYLVLERSNELNLYLIQNYYDELNVAKYLINLLHGIKQISYQPSDIADFLNDYEKNTGIQLAQNQKTAVITALTAPVSILTGGPGTGKTQTLNAIITAIRSLFPYAKIKICAPTGKAALRVSELTHLSASTIHRLLKVGRYEDELGEEELECDYLLVDEFSMVDCNLCAKLFRAACSSCRVVMVGDFEQLPSVGPGLILRDLIQSGVIKTTKLTEIFRQAGQSKIITNAHAIVTHKEGEPINLKVDHRPNKSFYFIERDSVSRIQRTITGSIDKLMNTYGYQMKDIKVLSPIRGSEIGTDALNLLLQDKYNPCGETYETLDGKEFRVGDPVIHIHNNYELQVFNGETGTIKALGYTVDRAILVEYPDNKHVWYDANQVDELELCYAMTVHKSQGSEFKVAVIPVHELLLVGLSKNLLYTAITRAKQMVILVGTKNATSIGLRKKTMMERNSNLIRRLQVA